MLNQRMPSFFRPEEIRAETLIFRFGGGGEREGVVSYELGSFLDTNLFLFDLFVCTSVSFKLMCPIHKIDTKS